MLPLHFGYLSKMTTNSKNYKKMIKKKCLVYKLLFKILIDHNRKATLVIISSKGITSIKMYMVKIKSFTPCNREFPHKLGTQY